MSGHWHSFQFRLPEDGIPIRVKVFPDKSPVLMVKRGETLNYKIRPDDAWQDARESGMPRINSSSNNGLRCYVVNKQGVLSDTFLQVDKYA